MAQVSDVLRSAQGGFLHWCPGCNRAHFIATERPTGPRWHFDGDLDAPTFSPSVRIFVPAHVDPDDGPQPEHTECHYFIKGGRIEFCGDSAHALAGQTVPMPSVAREDYGWGD